MQQLTPLEKSIGKLYENMPHLPKDLVDWLVENVWWIVLIGVLVGGLGALSVLAATFGGSIILGALGAPALGGVLFIAGLISVAVLIATVIIEAMAIQPLKMKHKYGWDLLFLAALVSLAGSVVAAILSLHIGGLFGPIVGAFIGFYFLYEIRGRYVVSKSTHK